MNRTMIIAGVAVLLVVIAIFLFRNNFQSLSGNNATSTSPSAYANSSSTSTGTVATPAKGAKTIVTRNGLAFEWPYAATSSLSTMGVGTSEVFSLMNASGQEVANMECGTFGRTEGPFESSLITSSKRTFSKNGLTYTATYDLFAAEVQDKNGIWTTGPADVVFVEVSPHRVQSTDGGVVFDPDKCMLTNIRHSSTAAPAMLKQVYDSLR